MIWKTRSGLFYCCCYFKRNPYQILKNYTVTVIISNYYDYGDIVNNIVGNVKDDDRSSNSDNCRIMMMRYNNQAKLAHYLNNLFY